MKGTESIGTLGVKTAFQLLRDEGGLGVQNLEEVSNAFAMQIWWHFRTSNTIGTLYSRINIVEGNIQLLLHGPDINLTCGRGFSKSGSYGAIDLLES